MNPNDKLLDGAGLIELVNLIKDSLLTKLNVHIGTSQDAGKFLVIDSNGDITTKTMEEWTGGSY